MTQNQQLDVWNTMWKKSSRLFLLVACPTRNGSQKSSEASLRNCHERFSLPESRTRRLELWAAASLALHSVGWRLGFVFQHRAWVMSSLRGKESFGVQVEKATSK